MMRGIADDKIGAGGLCSTGRNRGKGEGSESRGRIESESLTDFSPNFKLKSEKL